MLVIHQCQHIDRKGGLKLGLAEQAVEHHLRVGVPLQLNDHPHTVAVGLVPDIGNALQPLVLHLIGKALDQHPLIDLIGKLRNNDAGAVMAKLLKFMPRPDHNAAPACCIGRPDTGPAHDNALCGKIRSLDVLHQIGEGGIGVIQHADARADDLPQIVGRDIGGHTNGNAAGAVYQQVGEAGGKDTGLLPALVEVGVPVHGVLFDVPQHFIGNFAQPGLRITVGCRGIAIHGAEVAVTVHQHIAHGKVLRQTHQRVIHRGVAMGMVPAQHVAHAGSGLFKGLVRGQIVLVHGVQNTPVHRLQTVPHIRQGAAHNDTHGVFDIGVLHLRHQRRLHNFLIRVTNLLRIVLGLFTHFFSSLGNQ